MLSINVSHAKPFLSYPYEEVLCPRLEREIGRASCRERV